MTKALVVYHKNCNDGFAAAWCFHRFGCTPAPDEYTEVTYHEGVYGEPHPDTDSDTDCFILDFSYAPEQMIEAAIASRHYTVLDHHKSAMERWEIYKASGAVVEIPAHMDVRFDMTRSGAKMAYDYFADWVKSDRVPMIVLHVQDYDLWKFESPKTKSFIAYLNTLEKDFTVWSNFHDWVEHSNNGYASACDTGETLNYAFEKQCLDICKEAYELEIQGERGLVVNCTGVFASRIGNILAERSGTFGGSWYLCATGDTKFSLRSIGDYSVAAIAEKFGGGGHRNAAGFTYPGVYSHRKTQLGIKALI